MTIGKSLSGIGRGVGGIGSFIGDFFARQDLFTLIMILLVVAYVMFLIFVNNKYEKEKNLGVPKKRSLFKIKI